jgi:hypothetical protein
MDFNLTDYASPAVIIGAAVVLLVLIVAVAVLVRRRRESSSALHRRFGSEYDLALSSEGSRRKAEEHLHHRIRRVELLKIRELNVSERARYLAVWSTIQSRFIDHPRGAVIEAEELINSLLQVRGFPKASFDQRAADLSVNHSRLIEAYRFAHEITVRAAGNQATTEELRNAMIHYRALFDDLLQADTSIETHTLRRTA